MKYAEDTTNWTCMAAPDIAGLMMGSKLDHMFLLDSGLAAEGTQTACCMVTT